MRWVSVSLMVILIAAVGAVFFRTAGRASNERQLSTYLEGLAKQVTELEDKVNALVAHQIKSSEDNRQVYGAVARLCTIFEGILKINQGAEPAIPGEKE